MIDDARKLYLKYGGREHVQIELEMRAKGWRFYRQMLYSTGHSHGVTEGLPELFRVTRPGGLIVLTVKMTIWESGFAQYLDQCEAAGEAGGAVRGFSYGTQGLRHRMALPGQSVIIC